MKWYAFLLVISLIFGGCGTEPKPKNTAEPKPKYNPNPMFHTEYSDNGFAKFYKSPHTDDAIIECHDNFPELFLQSGNPYVIKSKGLAVPETYKERFFLIPIGDSSFSTLTSDMKDAIPVARDVLKSKYVIVDSNRSGKYTSYTLGGNAFSFERENLGALYLIGIERDKYKDFNDFMNAVNKKCPILGGELKKIYDFK